MYSSYQKKYIVYLIFINTYIIIRVLFAWINGSVPKLSFHFLLNLRACA